MRFPFILFLAALITGGVSNVVGAELDWRDEMKTQLAQQGNGVGKLEAECLRIRVSTAMLAIKTRGLLQQRLEILGPDCDDAAFDFFARDVLLNSQEYDRPYADVRLVISPEESFEEKIIPRGSRPPLKEKQTVRPGVRVTSRSAGERSQAIISDNKSKNQARRPSVSDVLFRPSFDVSRYQLQRSDDSSFILELKSGQEEFGVEFDRLSGLVTRYSITNNGSPELDVWQIGNQKAGKIYLPRVLAQAEYSNGQIRTLQVTFIRKASTDSVHERSFDHKIPEHAVVADVRGEVEEAAPRFVAPTKVANVDALLDEVASKTKKSSKTSSASGLRLHLFLGNLVVVVVAACFLLKRRTK